MNRRFSWLPAAILILAPVAAWADNPPADDAKLQAVMKQQLGLPSFFLTDEDWPNVNFTDQDAGSRFLKWPTIDFPDPAAAKAALGTYHVETHFQNASTNRGAHQSEIGPIYATSEVFLPGRPSMQRCFFVYRARKLPTADWKFDKAKPEELAEWAALKKDAVERQADLIASTAAMIIAARNTTPPSMVNVW